ncbi:MAG: DNA polymerase ligase N-terminal domain-containing protein [Candidatus Odinarchaeia archaeon]
MYGGDVYPRELYDIGVEGNHNYFAGNMLVSNSIPEGQYGAGTVKIWDKGDLLIHKRDENSIHFELFGEKMRGQFILIRFKSQDNAGKNWLFFKKKK